MPIYEYICNKCGNIFSILVMSRSSEDQITCPKCKGEDVVKKVSSFSCSLPSGGSGGFGGFSGGT